MMPILTPTIAARFGPPCRQKRLMSGKESSARKYAFGDRRMNTRRCSSIKFAKSAGCSSHAGEVAPTVISCLFLDRVLLYFLPAEIRYCGSMIDLCSL